MWICTTAGAPGSWSNAGSAGSVDSVTAGDASVVVGGTASAPTIETGTLDEIATLHPPAGNWSNNSYAITSVSDLAVSGLTGATVASRYVGATASGSPASGTFAVGDFVIDHTGVVWVCTTAGTPGTWTSAAALALPLTGGTMSGAIAMGSHKITGLTNGSGAQDAAAYGQLPAAGGPSYLHVPVSYGTGSTFTTTSATMAAVSSGNASTGTFTASTSGSVLVTADVVAQVSSSSTVTGWGLCVTGNITPMAGNVTVIKIPSASEPLPYTFQFLLTGLSGSSNSYDLMYCTNQGTLSVFAENFTSTAPTGGGPGSQIIMTVQAV